MGADATALSGTAVQEVANLAAKAAAEIKTEEIGEYVFSRQPLHRVDLDPKLPTPLQFYTLKGLIDFLQAETLPQGLVLVHVVSPTKVQVIGELIGVDSHLRRVFAEAAYPAGKLQGFSFNNFFSLETLAIALQTCFVQDAGEIQLLRTFCASVKSTESIGVADDGVSQSVEAKKGIAAVTTVGVRNPWPLAPFRTFSEIPQPISPFVLRFKEDLSAGLFETGDASWQVDAVKTIAAYLRQELVDVKVLG